MDQPVTKTPVLIETSRHQIVGNVSVPSTERLSDYANDPGREFFAITEAQMAPLDDPDRLRDVDFILVNRSEIALLRPGWSRNAAMEQPPEFRVAFEPATAAGF